MRCFSSRVWCLFFTLSLLPWLGACDRPAERTAPPAATPESLRAHGEEFREAVAVDEATWRRGRAWALIEGVLALSYYRGKNEAIAAAGRRTIDAVLGDWE